MYTRLVQGMRPRPSERTTSWCRTLYARIERDVGRLSQGDKTRNAELGLGLHPSVYFYICYCDPDFGDVATSFEAQQSPLIRVTPFDSGGFWYGYVATAGASSVNTAKPNLFQQLNYRYDDAGGRFEAFVQESYDHRQDYIGKVAPSPAFDPRIPAVAGNPRTWVWECRVERGNFAKAPLRPVALVMQRHRFRAYKQWIIDHPALAFSVKSKHMDLVNSIFLDCGDFAAGLFMNERLTSEYHD